MSQKRTRSIYVTDLEYEYVKKQLTILRTSSDTSYEKEIRERLGAQQNKGNQARAPQGDNHE
jgi:hypothetical protein